MEMEVVEAEYKPIHGEKSILIHTFVDTESALQMLDAAFCSLRRRKDALYVELKKPGIAADKERVRKLLTELDRICRAVRGFGAGYQLSRCNAHPDGLAGDEHIGSIVPRVMAELAARRPTSTVERLEVVL